MLLMWYDENFVASWCRKSQYIVWENGLSLETIGRESQDPKISLESFSSPTNENS